MSDWRWMAWSGALVWVLAACGNPNPEADTGTEKDGESFLCPLEEPMVGASCSADIGGCGYSSGTCRRTPLYSCTEGTWNRIDYVEPPDYCDENGDADAADAADGSSDAADGSSDASDVSDTDADGTLDAGDGDGSVDSDGE